MMSETDKKKYVTARQVLIVASILLSVIASVYVASRTHVHREYVLCIVFLVLAVLSGIFLLINKRPGLIGPICLGSSLLYSIAFVMFALGSVLDVSDYIAHVNFWGDATQFPAIMINGALLLAGTVSGIANCYIK